MVTEDADNEQETEEGPKQTGRKRGSKAKVKLDMDVAVKVEASDDEEGVLLPSNRGRVSRKSVSKKIKFEDSGTDPVEEEIGAVKSKVPHSSVATGKATKKKTKSEAKEDQSKKTLKKTPNAPPGAKGAKESQKASKAKVRILRDSFSAELLIRFRAGNQQSGQRTVCVNLQNPK